MAKYGIPYQGNKSKIAKDILEVLPPGNRLVDLFGGGFAISHCAMEEFIPDKWNEVLYNDINPLLPPLIKDAIDGKYSYDNFAPEWISQEEFFKRRDTDGYVKYAWSFGNNGRSYLFGRNIEEMKRQAHKYVVNGTKPDYWVPELHGETIQERRKEFSAYWRKNGTRKELQHLEHLERLEQLQQLERLEQLQRLEMTTMDYREYEYRDGDVVYCDIPYDTPTSKTCYGLKFGHKAFYEWAKAQPYPIFYSSYVNGDEPNLIWSKDKQSTICPTGCQLRKEGLLVL